MKRTLVWIAVLGVLVLPTVAFSEEASERVVKDDWGKGRHEEIQRLRQLKEKDPEAFKQAVQEKKTALRERLAHLKETDHNKAFYQLCTHMAPDYFQLEFDLRVYLTFLEDGSPQAP